MSFEALPREISLIVPVFPNWEAATTYLYLHPRQILKNSALSIFYDPIIIKEASCISLMIQNGPFLYHYDDITSRKINLSSSLSEVAEELLYYNISLFE